MLQIVIDLLVDMGLWDHNSLVGEGAGGLVTSH